MKNIFGFILAFFALCIGYSQNRLNDSFSVSYKGIVNHYVDSIYYSIPGFEKVEMQYIPGDFSYSVLKQIPVDFDVLNSSIQIENILYEDFSSANLGILPVDKLPNSPKVLFDFIQARDNKYLVFSFSPIVRVNNELKRVKDIVFSYVKKNASNARNTQVIPSVSNSVLATGDFYRFPITKSGVYKLTRSDLQRIFGTTSIDPRKIKIFGNGGNMLPLRNNVDVAFDLPENAIQVVGQEDGVLNDTDYVLFYAQGVDQWNVENNTSVHLYDKQAYYYISISGMDGKRIANAPILSTPSSQIIDTYHQIDMYENDIINVGRLGRKWVGESFSVNSNRDFTFEIPNLKTDIPVTLEVNAIANSSVSTNFGVRLNNTNVGNINFFAINSFVHVAAFENVLRADVNVTSGNLNVNLTYNNNGVPNSSAYLDFIKITSTNNLRGYGKQFKFYNSDTNTMLGVGEFRIQNAASISQVWNITDLYNITTYTNAQQNTFSFTDNVGEVKQYVAIDDRDIYNVSNISFTKVKNQNIKGTVFKNDQNQFQDVDYILIATPQYLSEANRLALLHTQRSNYNVKVIELQDIYNEFSSGQRDIAAIRNFMRYVYFNASTPDKRVKYLNLFGDTSFDYKDIIPNNNNIIPTFHYLANITPSGSGSSANFSNYSTYMSDDFFVLMDENEGSMQNNFQQGLDIAVGRILFSTPAQAKQMVDKIHKYYDKSSYGRWRNNIILLGDDIDAPSDLFLQSDLDAIAQNIENNRPFINIKKIYMDAYTQTVSAGGNRYVDAKSDFINSFDAGSLVVNYYGHGGERLLASERIFELSDVGKLQNNHKLPVFITITCEVSRFDNPYLLSLGESVFLNPEAGAIALLTTTREIGISNGRDINARLSDYIFNNTNTDIAIGEALRLTKNHFASLDRNVVFCIGDPGLKITFPKPKIVLNKINDQEINGSEDVLQALDYVTMEGEIRNEDETLLQDFNGDLAVQIFDKFINRSTLGNDNIINPNTNQVQIMDFVTLGETIFRGNASVQDGKFRFSFVVPKDIKIPVGTGRASFYAKTEQSNTDRAGVNTQIRIGGINNNAPTDNTPPVVKLYMNDTSFVSGGITNASPIFLAFIEDENGINTASGIGHDIIAILDGNETKPYVLNDFFETELNDYKNGKVRFPFKDLAPGLHTITFKAWDVYNNPVIAEIQFYVMDSEEVTLTNVLNYPNPFVNYTEFWFTHNRPFEPLKVQVQIMTISGKVVKTINEIVQTEGFLSRSIKWDGRDDFGDKIGKGVYIYRLTVQSSLTNKSSEKIEKLVIL